MNKIEKALDLIYNDNELKEKLIKLETLEEVYEFCASISGGYTREEFENFIAEMCKAAQGKLQEFSLPISDKDAEKISGGIQLKFVNNKSLASLLAMMTAASPMAYGASAANPSSVHGEVDSEETEEVEADESTDAKSEEADAEENDANKEESEGTAEKPAEDDNDVENAGSKSTDEEKGAEQEGDKSSSHVPAKVAGAGAFFTTLIFEVKRLFSTNKKSNSEEPNKSKDKNKNKTEDEDKQKDNKKIDNKNADNNKPEKPENKTPDSDGEDGPKENGQPPKIETNADKNEGGKQNKKDEKIKPDPKEPGDPVKKEVKKDDTTNSEDDSNKKTDSVVAPVAPPASLEIKSGPESDPERNKSRRPKKARKELNFIEGSLLKKFTDLGEHVEKLHKIKGICEGDSWKNASNNVLRKDFGIVKNINFKNMNSNANSRQDAFRGCVAYLLTDVNSTIRVLGSSLNNCGDDTLYSCEKELIEILNEGKYIVSAIESKAKKFGLCLDKSISIENSAASDIVQDLIITRNVLCQIVYNFRCGLLFKFDQIKGVNELNNALGNISSSDHYLLSDTANNRWTEL